MNLESRFIREIPADLLDNLNEKKETKTPFGQTRERPQRRGPVSRPQTQTIQNTGGGSIGWAVGDKAAHKKWGVGTVVSVKGSGDSTELDIAFPSPTGIKRLLAAFAPIEKQ